MEQLCGMNGKCTHLSRNPRNSNNISKKSNETKTYFLKYLPPQLQRLSIKNHKDPSIQTTAKWHIEHRAAAPFCHSNRALGNHHFLSSQCDYFP